MNALFTWTFIFVDNGHVGAMNKDVQCKVLPLKVVTTWNILYWAWVMNCLQIHWYCCCSNLRKKVQVKVQQCAVKKQIDLFLFWFLSIFILLRKFLCELQFQFKDILTSMPHLFPLLISFFGFLIYAFLQIKEIMTFSTQSTISGAHTWTYKSLLEI